MTITTITAHAVRPTSCLPRFVVHLIEAEMPKGQIIDEDWVTPETASWVLGAKRVLLEDALRMHADDQRDADDTQKDHYQRQHENLTAALRHLENSTARIAAEIAVHSGINASLRWAEKASGEA